MGQTLSTLGVSPPRRRRTLPGDGGGRSIFSEAVIVAFATGLMYAFAGAYQFGFQDQFNFTYISLGIEDVVDTSRKFLVPGVLSAAFCLMASFLVMFCRKTTSENSLSNVFILLFPVFFCGLMYYFYGNASLIPFFDRETYLLLACYYALDPSLWGAVARRVKTTPFAVPYDRYFRLAQILDASLVLVLIAFNLGKIDALTISQPTQCPDLEGRHSILLHMDGDLAICGEVDFDKRAVGSSLIYFKIPDDGHATLFHNIYFHPDTIGVVDEVRKGGDPPNPK